MAKDSRGNPNPAGRQRPDKSSLVTEEGRRRPPGVSKVACHTRRLLLRVDDRRLRAKRVLDSPGNANPAGRRRQEFDARQAAEMIRSGENLAEGVTLESVEVREVVQQATA